MARKKKLGKILGAKLPPPYYNGDAHMSVICIKRRVFTVGSEVLMPIVTLKRPYSRGIYTLARDITMSVMFLPLGSYFFFLEKTSFLTIYSEIPLLRPPKMKTSYLLKTLITKFKLFFSSFSTPSRRFTCTVKHYFLRKIRITCFENVVCQS